jgi:hypothetical protein
MKVRYTGAGYNLNNNDIYEVEESSQFEYKIRNDVGRLAWYVKTNFIEVKDKVSGSTSVTNTIPSELVNKIEKELKDTEKRMADLRKQLEDAKTPPTKNILLRETRQNPDWMYGEDFENAITNFSDELGESVPSLNKGICFSITNDGDGINLDTDYKWKIETKSDGLQVLTILDKDS